MVQDVLAELRRGHHALDVDQAVVFLPDGAVDRHGDEDLVELGDQLKVGFVRHLVD